LHPADFVSDLSPDAIATARGRYPANDRRQHARCRSAPCSPRRNALVVTKLIRDMVMFAQHDARSAVHPARHLSCRNQLIYFDATLYGASCRCFTTACAQVCRRWAARHGLARLGSAVRADSCCA
jgi:chemotaxis methyl-accepting protein methylase